MKEAKQVIIKSKLRLATDVAAQSLSAAPSPRKNTFRLLRTNPTTTHASNLNNKKNNFIVKCTNIAAFYC